MNPKVSVIVPNYNHSNYLRQRLDTVFNQTFRDFEVILLDDCSTDNSKEILLEYANKPQVSHCIFNEVNTGNTFKQWEKGISLSQGEFIWIAESDDFCELNFLEVLLKPLINDNKVVLSYCQSNKVNEDGIVTGDWIKHTYDLNSKLFLNDFIMNGNDFIEQFLIVRNVIPNASAVVFKKNVVDITKHLTIDPSFRYCGDWMFYFKILINNKNAFISKSLNYFRYHDNSVISKAKKYKERVTIIDLDFIMRKNLLYYLKRKKVSNFKKITSKNKSIYRELKYEKSRIYIKNNKKIKGFVILITVLDLFVKNYNFSKNLKIKFLRLFKLKAK
ncbi:glycosyltransferase family 2 protein [uncultured Lutibacter sp.]|uniref:glycosyltransferase family 2 protein n=1 Tax=uncultured Lutibacter sp. TaxID=437739 RepID=UPI0026180C93|nr:glycosyltransferase family 2 protein [uncultured Lutibacter sp.]